MKIAPRCKLDMGNLPQMSRKMSDWNENASRGESRRYQSTKNAVKTLKINHLLWNGWRAWLLNLVNGSFFRLPLSPVKLCAEYGNAGFGGDARSSKSDNVSDLDHTILISVVVKGSN